MSLRPDGPTGVLAPGEPCGVPASDVAERHCWAEIDSTGRVVTTHDARHVGCRQRRDRGSARRSRPIRGRWLGLQSGEGAEAAWDNLHGGERPARSRVSSLSGLGTVTGRASLV